MTTPICRFVGLDLGQVADYTALVILERPLVTLHDPTEKRRPVYALRHLHRYPLGTPYPEVVANVVKLLQTPDLTGCTLVVDQTGVGRPVVDMLTDAMRNRVTCRFMPVTITAGHQFTVTDKGQFHVPKKELVSAVQVLLQTRRLQIVRSLPEADVLLRELENFKVKITLARNESFECWREGVHDDLVLAVALAAWAGERALPPLYAKPEVLRPHRVIV